MLFFCDLETTGLDPISNDILEICILVVNKDLQIVDEFHSKVRPEIINDVTWSKEAENIHGYSVYEAMSFPERRSVLCSLMIFLNKYDSGLFVCHAYPEKFFDRKRNKWSWPNIDYHFLEWAYKKESMEFNFFSTKDIVSTIKMSMDYTGEKRGHKLSLWAQRIGFKLDHHNPRSDARACLAIYSEIIRPKELILSVKESPLEIEELFIGQ